jgi:hypothetical protein
LRHRAQALLAKTKDFVTHERGVDLLQIVISQCGAKIDTLDFGADDGSERCADQCHGALYRGLLCSVG